MMTSDSPPLTNKGKVYYYFKLGPRQKAQSSQELPDIPEPLDLCP